MITPLFACLVSLSHQAGGVVQLKPYSLPIGVSINLPSKPQKRTDPANPSTELYVSIANKTAFVVGSSKMHPRPGQGPPDQQLAASVMGTKEAIPGKLVRYQDVLLNGWPGVEFELKGKTMSSWVRNFDVDNTMVSIGVTYSAADGPPTYTKKVLDSITLATDTKPGPFATTDLPFKVLTVQGVPFSIEIPDLPKDEPTTIEAPFGEMVVHRFHYERDLRDLVFSYTDIPDAAMEGAPENGEMIVREFFAKSITQRAQKPINLNTVTLNGNEWTTCSYRITDFASGRVDVLYKDKRIYIILETGPDPWVQSPVFKHMFDSFQITKTP